MSFKSSVVFASLFCLTDVPRPLLQQHLTEAGGEDPSIAKRERCSLCTSLCHTATAYQYANDLDAAIGACAEAAKQVEICDSALQACDKAATIISF
jgi:hypothetical protein